jgi:hypothetical protein
MHPLLFDGDDAVGKRPDEKALQAVLAEAWRLLDSSGLDPAVARSTFFLAAAAARSNSAARKQLAAQVQRAIAAADEQAAAGGPLAKTQRRSAANDWDLQHTAFATSRLAGTANGADEISRSFAVGVGSGDPVGARHALALGFDVALRVSAVLQGSAVLGQWQCCTSCFAVLAGLLCERLCCETLDPA